MTFVIRPGFLYLIPQDRSSIVMCHIGNGNVTTREVSIFIMHSAIQNILTYSWSVISKIEHSDESHCFIEHFNVAFEISTSIWQKKISIKNFKVFFASNCVRKTNVVNYRMDYPKWEPLFWNPWMSDLPFRTVVVSMLGQCSDATLIIS